MCDASERLINGWCTPTGDGSDNTTFTHGSVVGHSKTDTIGAQWKCSHDAVRVTAFAMCQKLPPAAPPAPAPPQTIDAGDTKAAPSEGE
jgi:hypothetical protein